MESRHGADDVYARAGLYEIPTVPLNMSRLGDPSDERHRCATVTPNARTATNWVKIVLGPTSVCSRQQCLRDRDTEFLCRLEIDH